MLHVGLELCYRTQCNLASTSKLQRRYVQKNRWSKVPMFWGGRTREMGSLQKMWMACWFGGCHHISVEVTRCRAICSLTSLVFACQSFWSLTQRCSIEQVPPQNVSFFFKQPLVCPKRVAEPVRKHFLLIRPELQTSLEQSNIIY